MKKINNLLTNIVLSAIILFSLGCEDKEWGEDYDISWPVPEITSLSSNDAFIDEIITINGTNLDKVTSIKLAGQDCEIVEGSASASSIQFKIARRAETGIVTLKNVYRRESASMEALKVNYPNVLITGWPTKLVSGEAFNIEGENVDLITEVSVNGQTLKITSAASTTKITVPTAGMVLIPGETAVIKVNALGEIGIDEVSGIAIEEPTDIFDAAEPIILWDFEDGAPDMVDVENDPAQAGINLGGISKGRGDNYFSVLNPGEDSGWKTYFYIRKQGPIDLSTFHEPYITFLVNTNGNRGYINPFMTQDGSAKDNHLHNGNAADNLKYDDNYAVQTEGWEWRSYPIAKLFGDFNPTGVFDEVAMRFISGNVGNGDGVVEDFEIHVDQIMITDGPQNPIAKVFDFEDGNDVWEDNGFNANHVVKSESPFGSGNSYYAVWLTAEASWNWTGAIGNYNAVDLSTAIDPHLSFIYNTNGNKGMVQVEVWQNDTKWGGSVDMSDYFIQSDGWAPLSIRLIDHLGNWGGDASEFDPAAPIDYVKIGFTTGNVGAGEEYEVNIDDIYISDGKMW